MKWLLKFMSAVRRKDSTITSPSLPLLCASAPAPGPPPEVMKAVDDLSTLAKDPVVLESLTPDDTAEIRAIQESLGQMFPGMKFEMLPEVGTLDELEPPPPPKPNPKTSTKQILGAALPIDAKPRGVSQERVNNLQDVSHELKVKLRNVQRDFMLELGEKYKHTEKTYVVFDAHAALIAEWGCSVDTINKTTMGVADGVMKSVELVQHNFAEQQKTMYDMIGNWIH